MSIPQSLAMEEPRAPRRWMHVAGKPVSATAVFAHVGMFTCIILQRFAIPLGPSASLSISLPVFWGLTLWMLLSKRGRFAPGRSFMFLLFVSWAILSAVGALLAPDPRVGFSLLSLINVLFLYLPVNVRPTEEFDGRVVREAFLFYVRICAVFGIAQFALQFVHIRLFSFGQMFPALNPFLLEKDFAWNPLLAYGSTTTRSNGFFLLEPSIFSQMLCLAILIDLFIVNRWRYLPLYAIAYMVSYSGTGLLTLAITLVIVGATSAQYSMRVLGLALLAVVVGGLASVVLPDQFAVFAGRFGELGSTQSSGYHRYVSPFIQLGQFVDGARMLLGYGPGSTMRSIYFENGTGNSAVQICVDYGVVGLVLFLIFLFGVLTNRRYIAVTVLLVLIFELGGAYFSFPPYIFLLTMLGIWMPTTEAEAQRAIRPQHQAWRRSPLPGRRISGV